MLFRNNYRNCGQKHLRAYPGCYEECNRDICDFVPPLTPPTVFETYMGKQMRCPRCGEWMRPIPHLANDSGEVVYYCDTFGCPVTYITSPLSA